MKGRHKTPAPAEERRRTDRIRSRTETRFQKHAQGRHGRSVTEVVNISETGALLEIGRCRGCKYSYSGPQGPACTLATCSVAEAGRESYPVGTHIEITWARAHGESASLQAEVRRVEEIPLTKHPFPLGETQVALGILFAHPLPPTLLAQAKKGKEFHSICITRL